jgi:DNA polymerase III epsilon subunit-like protein
MQHWNRNQICGIDTETTGLDPNLHEIWQIAIVPVDADLEIRNMLPFSILMKPNNPELIDWEVPVMKRNKSRVLKAINEGFAKDIAIQLFLEWLKRLELGVNKFGADKKIIPLGHNYAFDQNFIKAWLGPDLYGEIFDYHFRDTMVAALWLNDKAAVHAEQVPFSKVNLSWLAKTLNLDFRESHDALNDAVMTIKCYKRLVATGLF